MSLNSNDRLPGLSDTHIVLNPHSGSSRNNSIIIAKVSSQLDIPEDNIHVTEKPGHATLIAQKIADTKDSIIFAAGGDGTVNETARGIIDSNSILGVLPLGSGNGFARHLKVPVNLNQYPSRLSGAHIERLDVGLHNDVPFLAVSSVGFSAYVADLFGKFGARGPLPYFMLSLKSFFKYHSFTYRLDCDGEISTGDAFDISIANSTQFGNGAKIAPNASSEDGFLDVVIIKKPTSLELPKIGKDLFAGKLQANKNFTFFKARNISLQVDIPLKFYHIDGEPFSVDSKQFSWKIKPKCLNVIDFR